MIAGIIIVVLFIVFVGGVLGLGIMALRERVDALHDEVEAMRTHIHVVPAEAGTQKKSLDSRLRGNDELDNIRPTGRASCRHTLRVVEASSIQPLGPMPSEGR